MGRSQSDTNKTLPVSVRLQPELNEQVSAIARALHRPKSWVIEQALKDFVAVQTWQMVAIDEGIRAADASHVVAHDEVAKWVNSWDKPDELPMPVCK